MTRVGVCDTNPQPLPYRWVMLGLVWPAYCSFGMVSRSLAPLVSGVTADLGVAYAGGRVIDRVGLRRALGLGLLAIGASGILRAGASGFGTMFAFVALFGLGGPMVSIGAPKLIATWFEGAERGKAAGIYTTGPALGGAIVFSTANALLLPLTGSWRLTVATYGLVALAVGAIWWLLARNPPNAEPSAAGGLYFTVGEIGGFTGPSLLGYLFDLTGGFVVGLALNAALLATVAAGCLRLDREATP